MIGQVAERAAAAPASSREIIAFCRAFIRQDPARVRVTNWSSLWRLALMALITLSGMWLAVQPQWWGWVLAFFLVGLMQYHLLVASHEAIHLGLFRPRWLNDLAGRLVCWLQLVDLQAIRDHHNRHHQHYGFDEDPDRDDHHNFPSWIDGHWRASWQLLYNGLFLTNLSTKVGRSSQPSSAFALLGKLMTMAAVAGVFVLLGGHWWHLFAFWVAPLLLLSRLFNNLRMFGEHFGLQRPSDLKQDQIFTARTTCDARPWWRAPYSALERYVLAPFNFNYHFEHHAAPAIPYDQLPALHRALREWGHYERHPALLAENYRRTFMSVYDCAASTP